MDGAKKKPEPIRPQVGEVWEDNIGQCWKILHEDTTSEDLSLALTARACDSEGTQLGLGLDTFSFDGMYGGDGRALVRKVEPPKVVYVNVYGPGNGYGYASREIADSGASCTRIACVRVPYVEGQFDG